MAFYSRQLQGAEHHYSVTELESLAIVAAVKHFEFYLYGAAFTVYTDHRCMSLLGITLAILSKNIINSTFVTSSLRV